MKQKGGKMSFADFLDVMHIHSSKENIPKELLDAFRGSDPGMKGVIPAKDLWNILTKWGEKISPREGKDGIEIEQVYNSFLIKWKSFRVAILNQRYSKYWLKNKTKTLILYINTITTILDKLWHSWRDSVPTLYLRETRVLGLIVHY